MKKTNILESIILIKQALKLDPEYPCYDKLIKYLLIAKKFNEAEEIILSLIKKSENKYDIDNFSNRACNYTFYSDFSFKKTLYKDYLFYYCLSIYNKIVMDALNEQIDTVKAQLKVLKNLEELKDRKTNKAFQEIGLLASQGTFIKTFYEVLISFDFEKLYKLVIFLNHKQPNKMDLEIYSFENQKKDWLLWSSKEFRDTIVLFNQDLFTTKYKSHLEPIINNSNTENNL